MIKKILILVSLVLMFMDGCAKSAVPVTPNTVQKPPVPVQSQTPPPAKAPPPGKTSPPASHPGPDSQNNNVQTYENTEYHFRFEYPSEFQLISPTYAFLNHGIVQIQIPSSTFPGTNFVDAAFTVSVQNTASEQECLDIHIPDESNGFYDTADVNGNTFYETDGLGAGTGNLYSTRTYRIFRNAVCLEINETLHTSRLGNYAPGTVTEIDANQVWTKLDAILATFEFID